MLEVGRKAKLKWMCCCAGRTTGLGINYNGVADLTFSCILVIFDGVINLSNATTISLTC